MFKLMKLAFYGLVAWSMYQMYQGITEGRTAVRSRRKELSRALNQEEGRMAILSGPGRGTTESTEEASGASAPHIVGRGVTLR